ncbi:MAG: hypothetical protein ACKOEX_05500, partial [Planctomycetia bacterium]
MKARNVRAGMAGLLALCCCPIVARAFDFRTLLPEASSGLSVAMIDDGLSPGLESVLVGPPEHGEQFDPNAADPIISGMPYAGDARRLPPPPRASRGDRSLKQILRGGADRWAFEADAVMLWQG